MPSRLSDSREYFRDCAHSPQVSFPIIQTDWGTTEIRHCSTTEYLTLIHLITEWIVPRSYGSCLTDPPSRPSPTTERPRPAPPPFRRIPLAFDLILTILTPLPSGATRPRPVHPIAIYSPSRAVNNLLALYYSHKRRTSAPDVAHRSHTSVPATLAPLCTSRRPVDLITQEREGTTGPGFEVRTPINSTTF